MSRTRIIIDVHNNDLVEQVCANARMGLSAADATIRRFSVQNPNEPGVYALVQEQVEYRIPIDAPDGLDAAQLHQLHDSHERPDGTNDDGAFADDVDEQVIDRVGDHYVTGVTGREIVGFEVNP